jgi:hypothetical protein
MFCLTAVLRSPRKEYYLFEIRSLIPPAAGQQAPGNALAIAVQQKEKDIGYAMAPEGTGAFDRLSFDN